VYANNQQENISTILILSNDQSIPLIVLLIANAMQIKALERQGDERDCCRGRN